jgi:hypothetical protein
MLTYKTISTLAAASLFIATGSFAQIKSPAASPLSKLDQVVGVTNFTVEYSRPGVKDREIYGALVPFGEIWRTGANATTKIAFDTEVTFEGQTVPAGQYVLFSIPSEDEWTVIIYGDTKVPNAAAYDSKNDVARFTVESIELSDSVENFTIGFDDLRDESATLYLDWANLRVPVGISVDTNALTAASIEAAMDSLDSWSARNFADAAEFYHKTGENPERALDWMEKAVSMNKNAFWWQHTYAKMLSDHGKTKQAIAAAEMSLKTAKASTGGDSGYIALNEALLASLR